MKHFVPVVADIGAVEDLQMSPNAREVAAVFAVRLRDLCDTSRWHQTDYCMQPLPYTWLAVPIDEPPAQSSKPSPPRFRYVPSLIDLSTAPQKRAPELTDLRLSYDLRSPLMSGRSFGPYSRPVFEVAPLSTDGGAAVYMRVTSPAGEASAAPATSGAQRAAVEWRPMTSRYLPAGAICRVDELSSSAPTKARALRPTMNGSLLPNLWGLSACITQTLLTVLFGEQFPLHHLRFLI